MSFSRSIVMVGATLLLLAIGAAGCGSGGTGSADSFLSEAGLPADAAVITDPKDDVRDVDGNKPPEDAKTADIIRAAIHLSDTELMLAVEHAAPIPTQLEEIDYGAGIGEWLSYTVFIADEQGTITYMPQVGLASSEWSAFAYSKETGDSTELEGAPQISGSVLTYAFPRESMPDLQAPFKWGVGMNWERTSGPEIADRESFGDQATQDGKDGWTGYPYEWAEYPQQ